MNPDKKFYWYIIRNGGENLTRSGMPSPGFYHNELFTQEEITSLNDLAKPYRQLKLSPDQVRSACINKLRNPVVEGIEPPTPTDGGAWI